MGGAIFNHYSQAHEDQAMIRASDLRKLLAQYDNAVSRSQPLHGLEIDPKIMTLRLLARAKSNPDLTPALSNMMRSYKLPSSERTHWAPSDLLFTTICIQCNMPGFPIAPGFSSVEEAQQPPLNTKDVLPWFYNQIKTIQTKLGGEFDIEAVSVRGISQVTVKAHGSLEMKYSIFMTCRNADLIASNSPTQCLDESHISGDLSMTLDSKKLTQLFLSSSALDYTRNFLTTLGFSIQVGSKTGNQLFSANDDFRKGDNYQLRAKYAVDLQVAQILNQSPNEIVLPLTLKILTRDDRLMTQLESYFAHPMVNLVGANSKPKTFILETRDPGMLHESNLDLSQMLRLMDFFERLSFFSKYLGVVPVSLDEATIIKASEEMMGVMLNNERRILDFAKWKSINFNSPVLLEALSSSSLQQQCRDMNMSTSTSRVNIGDFEQLIKKELNDNFIPGPYVFVAENKLFHGINEVFAEVGTQESELIETIEGRGSYPDNVVSPVLMLQETKDDITSSPIPSSPLPILTYVNAVARHCIEGTCKTISDSGITWLNKTVDRNTYGGNANQSYLNFFIKNNAYFILDNMISNIKTCLDNPRCTDNHVAKLLSLLGVKEEDLRFYKMAEYDGKFNRFQIKFFLLPLVLSVLIQNDLLVNFEKLRQMRHGWVTQIVNSEKSEVAIGIEQWYKFMVGFKTSNAIYGLDWVPGGPSMTSTMSGTFGDNRRSTLFAGGYSADTRRVQATSSYSYGSSS